MSGPKWTVLRQSINQRWFDSWSVHFYGSITVSVFDRPLSCMSVHFKPWYLTNASRSSSYQKTKKSGDRRTLNDFDNFSWSIWSFFSCFSSSLMKSFSIFGSSRIISPLSLKHWFFRFDDYIVWLARGQLLHFTTLWLTLWLIHGKHFLSLNLAIDQWKTTAAKSKLNWKWLGRNFRKVHVFEVVIK